MLFNKSLKLIVALMLCVAALLSMTACSNNFDENQEVPSAQIGEQVTQPVVPEVLVKDAYAKEISFTIDDYAYNYAYYIPKIMLDSKGIQCLNEEIYNLFINDVEEAVSLLDNKDFPSYDNLSYEWAVKDDILSLVISSGSVDFGNLMHYVYNVSISEAKVLSNEEVLSAANTSEEDYSEKVKQVLGSNIWNNIGGYFEMANADSVEFFNKQLTKTISDENVSESIPYFNEAGQLCFAAKQYSLAGADYYWNLYNTEDFELNPKYDSLAELN